jgi:uncharacterized protein YndB with AHSA1/START domain
MRSREEGAAMGRDILHAVGIEADPSTVFDAITTAEGLAGFWTPKSQAEPEVGSVAEFGFSEAPVPLRMRVDELDPGRRVRWTCLGLFPYWEGTTVSWELGPGPDGSGTHIMFRHEGWADDYPEHDYAGVNFVWGQVVARLKAYAETGESQPFLG